MSVAALAGLRARAGRRRPPSGPVPAGASTTSQGGTSPWAQAMPSALEAAVHSSGPLQGEFSQQQIHHPLAGLNLIGLAR